MALSALTIKIVDPDDDYLGIEIRAINERFSGTTFIYAGLHQLSDLAAHITGFPQNAHDEKSYAFGSRETVVAGEYCSLRFHCLDCAGHTAVTITLDDDDRRHTEGTVTLSFRIEPAGIDRFAEELQELEATRRGEAMLLGNE